MKFESAEEIGIGLIIVASLLSLYLLALKIWDYHKEKPDPKLTYVTHVNLERMRCELMRIITEEAEELRNIRCELRDDIKCISKTHMDSLSAVREMIARNSQDTSALSAQMQLINQRITELSIKTDKLIFRKVT